MLSYEHIYHAGNHADILKHIVLTLTISHLKKKSTPFTLIDSHAGCGWYDLIDSRAQKTNEAASGLLHYLSFVQAAAESGAHQRALQLLTPFTEIVAGYQKQNRYAGSPEIARCLLRKTDSLVLSELHPQAIEVLRKNMQQKRLYSQDGSQESVLPQIHYRNGFELLTSIAPPSRGLVLVDPSYEEVSDFTEVSKTLCHLHHRWRGGIFVLWYPLTLSKGLPCSRMRQDLISCVQNTARENRILDLQLTVRKAESLEGKAALFGSGVMVVNFPYELDKEMEEIMPLLEAMLAGKDGKGKIQLY